MVKVNVFIDLDDRDENAILRIYLHPKYWSLSFGVKFDQYAGDLPIGLKIQSFLGELSFCAFIN